MQIILIDDGSKDNSLKICKQYCRQDTRVEIIEQENLGVSIARNRGMKIIKGEVVTFIDSDDFIEVDMIEKLVKALHAQNADIACCSYNSVSEDSRFIKKSDSGYSNLTFSGTDGLGMMFSGGVFTGFLWSKLFKKSVIENYCFQNDLDICEDMYFLSQILTPDLRIAYTNDQLYNYRISSTSLTKNFEKLFDSDNNLKYVVAMERIAKLFPDNYNMIKLIKNNEVHLVVANYRMMIKNKKFNVAREKKFYHILSENKGYLFSKEESLHYKVAYCLFYTLLLIRTFGGKINE